MTASGRDFAEQYVSYVLLDDPIPTADAEYAFVNEVLDRATPATVAYGFVERLDTTAPQILVVVPDTESTDVPGAEVFVEQIAAMGDRDVEPRVTTTRRSTSADGRSRSGRGVRGRVCSTKTRTPDTSPPSCWSSTTG